MPSPSPILPTCFLIFSTLPVCLPFRLLYLTLPTCVFFPCLPDIPFSSPRLSFPCLTLPLHSFFSFFFSSTFCLFVFLPFPSFLFCLKYVCLSLSFLSLLITFSSLYFCYFSFYFTLLSSSLPFSFLPFRLPLDFTSLSPPFLFFLSLLLIYLFVCLSIHLSLFPIVTLTIISIHYVYTISLSVSPYHYLSIYLSIFLITTFNPSHKHKSLVSI